MSKNNCIRELHSKCNAIWQQYYNSPNNQPIIKVKLEFYKIHTLNIYTINITDEQKIIKAYMDICSSNIHYITMQHFCRSSSIVQNRICGRIITIRNCFCCLHINTYDLCCKICPASVEQWINLWT